MSEYFAIVIWFNLSSSLYSSTVTVCSRGGGEGEGGGGRGEREGGRRGERRERGRGWLVSNPVAQGQLKECR